MKINSMKIFENLKINFINTVVPRGGIEKFNLKFGGAMIKPKPKNYNRQVIIDNFLLQYIDYTNTIPRNKDIIKDYASGKSYKELSEKYGVCIKTIAGMIANYVNKVSRYCAKNGIDYRKQCSN